jgi:hypothetical protein
MSKFYASVARESADDPLADMPLMRCEIASRTKQNSEDDAEGFEDWSRGSGAVEASANRRAASGSVEKSPLADIDAGLGNAWPTLDTVNDLVR